METRANYLLVGFFMLALAAAGVFFAIWLTKASLNQDLDRYEIRFGGSVGGLKVGAPVSFRGVRVGEVAEITIDPETLDVVVTVEVEAATPVRQDTKATLGLQGLAGGTFILLKGGSGDAPPLMAEAEGRLPRIPSEPSPLDQIIADAPAVLDDVRLTLSRVRGFLSDENRQALSDILSDTAKVSAMLAGRREQIGRTIDNAEVATEEIKTLTETINARSGQIADQIDATLATLRGTAKKIDGAVEETSTELTSAAGRLDGTLRDISQAAQAIEGMAGEVEALVAENRPAVREFTGNGVYELLSLMTELRELALSLNRLTREVERDPARFLFGNQQEGYEVPN